MRRWFMLVIATVLIAACLVYGLNYDTGYVKVTYGHWLVETNVWVLAALNVTFILAIWLIMFILKGTLGGAAGLVHWARIRPKKKANLDAQKGFLAFLEGDWESAQHLLTKSSKHARMPIVNLLAAANAANQRGLHKESSALLKQAHELDGGSELAANLTQARLHIENERFEAALAVLVRLKKAHPRHPFITQLLVQVYTQLEDWEQLAQQLEGEGAAKLDLEPDFERKVWSKLFESYADKLGKKAAPDEVSDTLSELWKRVPNKLRYDEHVIYAYTRELLNHGLDHDAEVILRKVLDRSWSENLVDAYGMTRGADRTEQLIHAETWLRERPNSPRLLLALGRLSLRCELWGKAVEYFIGSQKQQSSLEASAELYRLYQALQKPEHETRALLTTLMHHIHLPDLPQPKAR